MRHTAAFRYQFPVTAYVTPLVFQNPPATADIQEKMLATDGEVLDYYRSVETFTFHFDIRILTGKLILLFQVNHDFTTAFPYIGNVEIIQCPFGKKETVTVSFHNYCAVVAGKDKILSDILLRVLR